MMTNNEQWRVFTDMEKQKIIAKCKNEFEHYKNYLTTEFFSNELEIFEELYDPATGLAPEISFKIFIKNKALKRLGDLVNSGDIDLEIELIEEYTPLINKLLNRLGIDDESFNVETILERALMTYDSSKFFSVHIVKTIKNFNQPYQTVEDKRDDEELESPIESIETKSYNEENKKDDIIPVSKNDGKKLKKKEKAVKKTNNEDLKIKENIIIKPKNTNNIESNLEDITVKNNISKKSEDKEKERNDTMIEIKKPVPTKVNLEKNNSANITISEANNSENNNDIIKNEYIKVLEIFDTPEFMAITREKPLIECLIVSLKLGYIDGKYFSDEAIASFLGIRADEVKTIFQECLVEYKECLNKMIEQVINNDCDFSDTNVENTKKYYTKKLEKRLK